MCGKATESRTTMNKEQQDKAMILSLCKEKEAKAKNMGTEDAVNVLE